ncbi:MAG: proline dehydrogenase, partial [Marinilabiliales bacterium]
DLNVSEAKEIDKFKGRVDLLCRSAHEKGVPILVDAEEYAYQDGVDRVVNEMMQKYNKERAIVYNTLQMYRWDRYGFLVAELEKANQKGYFLGIKLVRGAYMEKERALSEKYNYPSPINSTKEETDKEFNKAVKFVMNNLMNMSLFCGTHNEESIHMAIHLMNDLGIEKDDKRVFFSQLYGMSDNISFNLAAQGYNVAKYLPYGPVESVMPYLIRRAQENTAVAGQMSRELMLLKKEKQRRKNSKNGSR